MGDLIYTIHEGKRYELYNLVLQNYFGVKLATATITSALVSGKSGELAVLSDGDFEKYIDHEDVTRSC